MKKILLGLGVIGTIATPLSVAAGCGNDTNKTPEKPQPPKTPEKPQQPQVATLPELGSATGNKKPVEQKTAPTALDARLRFDLEDKKTHELSLERARFAIDENKTHELSLEKGRIAFNDAKDVKNLNLEKGFKEQVEEMKYNASKGHVAHSRKGISQLSTSTEKIDEIITNAAPFEEKYFPKFTVKGYAKTITIIPWNLAGYELYENEDGSSQWFVKIGTELPKGAVRLAPYNKDVRYFMTDFKVEEKLVKDNFEAFAWNKNDSALELAIFLDLRVDRPINWSEIKELNLLPIPGKTAEELAQNTKKAQFEIIGQWVKDKLFGTPLPKFAHSSKVK